MRNINAPIVFEKPVTSSYALTKKLFESSFSNDRYVFFQRRISPELRSFKRLLQEFNLASPVSALIHISKPKGPSDVKYLSH